MVNLWDTVGQEKFESLTKLFLKDSEIVIFVYDITDKKSFESLEKWMGLCKEVLSANQFVSAVVGNKIDLYAKEQVKEDDAKKFAQLKGMQFKLISAKETPEYFQLLLEELIEELEKFSGSNIRESIRLTQLKEDKKRKKCDC